MIFFKKGMGTLTTVSILFSFVTPVMAATTVVLPTQGFSLQTQLNVSAQSSNVLELNNPLGSESDDVTISFYSVPKTWNEVQVVDHSVKSKKIFIYLISATFLALFDSLGEEGVEVKNVFDDSEIFKYQISSAVLQGHYYTVVEYSLDEGAVKEYIGNRNGNIISVSSKNTSSIEQILLEMSWNPASPVEMPSGNVARQFYSVHPGTAWQEVSELFPGFSSNLDSQGDVKADENAANFLHAKYPGVLVYISPYTEAAPFDSAAPTSSPYFTIIKNNEPYHVPQSSMQTVYSDIEIFNQVRAVTHIFEKGYAKISVGILFIDLSESERVEVMSDIDVLLGTFRWTATVDAVVPPDPVLPEIPREPELPVQPDDPITPSEPDDSAPTPNEIPRQPQDDGSSESDRQARIETVLARERTRLAVPEQSLISRVSGKILLQVKENGEAWYVNPTDGRRHYLPDGEGAYALMRSLGLGITTHDLKKIPINQVYWSGENGFEYCYDHCAPGLPDDNDNDELQDRLEQALGTNPHDSDSDDDGFADGLEVRRGYDPLSKSPLKLPVDQQLVNRLKGKIVLQVEGKGEAWYIHPDNGHRYYLKDGQAAYALMRALALGVTNETLNKIPLANR